MRIIIFTLILLLSSNAQADQEIITTSSGLTKEVQKLELALDLAKNFHPITGQNFITLQSEFIAWEEFKKQHGSIPRTFVYKNCYQFADKPNGDKNKKLSLLNQCYEWGWTINKRNGVYF